MGGQAESLELSVCLCVCPLRKLVVRLLIRMRVWMCDAASRNAGSHCVFPEHVVMSPRLAVMRGGGERNIWCVGLKMSNNGVDRAGLKVTRKYQSLTLHLNKPTVVAVLAVASLCAASPYTNPELDAFTEAGGVTAAVRLVNKSTCRETLGHTLDLIKQLLLCGEIPGCLSWHRRFVGELYESGDSLSLSLSLSPPPCLVLSPSLFGSTYLSLSLSHSPCLAAALSATCSRLDDPGGCALAIHT